MESVTATSSSLFLTFRLHEQLYALPAEHVSEVIHVPAVARVPQGPTALIGIANLRGTVLPVASLREMLGLPASVVTPATRAVVLDVGAPIAIVVDAVVDLQPATARQIESPDKALATETGEALLGVFSIGDERVAKILDIQTLLERAFSKRTRGRRQEGRPPKSTPVARAADRAVTQVLVTFEVANQEFALPLEDVQEILPAPSSITAVARTDAAVLGITTVRGALLPLLSLRTLLGVSGGHEHREREKVVVMKIGGAQVGLVADRARAILAADLTLIDPVPPLLAARAGGESRIKSVYRGDAGRRLISILSPEQVFKDDVMKRVATSVGFQSSPLAQRETVVNDERIFLVFRLGDDEFGLPIDSVVEVAQVPAQITRVPRTPKFLEGVVNIRGEVLPVVDQRRRFDMPALKNVEGRRLVVINTSRHRAGVIVDSVSDVLRASAGQIAPPPELTESTSRLVSGVLNLEKSERMVLLLDPTELLTRAEQGLLDTFQAKSRKDSA